MVTLTDEDAELVADAVVKRLAARERLRSRTADREEESHLLSYGKAGELIERSKNAIKMMVYRKELKAVHPGGGRRAFIESRELHAYLNGRKKGKS